MIYFWHAQQSFLTFPFWTMCNTSHPRTQPVLKRTHNKCVNAPLHCRNMLKIVRVKRLIPCLMSGIVVLFVCYNATTQKWKHKHKFHQDQTTIFLTKFRPKRFTQQFNEINLIIQLTKFQISILLSPVLKENSSNKQNFRQQGGSSYFHVSTPVHNGFLRFTTVATTAFVLGVTMEVTSIAIELL